MPLIPGITTTEANIRALAGFIREKNPGGRVELINFNPLAVNKYSLMNRGTEFFSGMAPLPEGAVETLRARCSRPRVSRWSGSTGTRTIREVTWSEECHLW